jgi:UDP-N-acetylmuramate--alanine ligase
LGEGDFLVYEACEAFGSINFLNGEIVCITNIDNDHMEYYKSFDQLKNTFLDYINRIPFYGFAALNGDDPEIRSLLPSIRKKYYLFGLHPDNQIQAYDIKTEGFHTTFKVKWMGEFLAEFVLQVPGIHNIYNSLAAISIAKNLGVETEVIQKSLCQFVNADRRFQLLGEKNNIFVIDDYAHHPTEVEATIDAAFQLKNGKIKRVVTIFQPHLFSRTQIHYKNFARSLAKSDFVLLNEIYPAREKPIPGVSSGLIEEVFKRIGYKNYCYCHSFQDTLDKIESFARSGDLYLTMGAGDIHQLGPHILSRIEQKKGHTCTTVC